MDKDSIFSCECCCKVPHERVAAIPISGDKIDIRKVISELDAFFAKEDLASAQSHLEAALLRARELGDKTGELSVLSELMGFHRRTADRAAALSASYEGIALVKELDIGKSVTGATVLLNAATTLSAYGEAKEAMPVFDEALRVYSANLDPNDYRFAGLYNNFGTACVNLALYEKALGYYRAALSLMKKTNNKMEIAVTHMNIAQLYDEWGREDRDERVSEHVEAVLYELESATVRDGYYAFTCRKCAPTLDRLGYFFDARRLNERADKIYAGN